MNLRVIAEHIRDTNYSEPCGLFADCMAFDRALVLDMMQTPVYRPYKAELFVALREITEWQRSEDRTWEGFMRADSLVSRIIQAVRQHPAEMESV